MDFLWENMGSRLSTLHIEGSPYEMDNILSGAIAGLPNLKKLSICPFFTPPEEWGNSEYDPDYDGSISIPRDEWILDNTLAFLEKISPTIKDFELDCTEDPTSNLEKMLSNIYFPNIKSISLAPGPEAEFADILAFSLLHRSHLESLSLTAWAGFFDRVPNSIAAWYAPLSSELQHHDGVPLEIKKLALCAVSSNFRLGTIVCLKPFIGIGISMAHLTSLRIPSCNGSEAGLSEYKAPLDVFPPHSNNLQRLVMCPSFLTQIYSTIYPTGSQAYTSWYWGGGFKHFYLLQKRNIPYGGL
jgi:hypothetical protein